MSSSPKDFFTDCLPHILDIRAQQNPAKILYTYLIDGENEEVHLTYSDLDLQARSIGTLLQSQHAAGKRALLLYPPGLDYIAAFLGCLYASVIAIPAYPPRNKRHIPRLRAMIADSQAQLVLTTSMLLSDTRMRSLLSQEHSMVDLTWLTTDTLDTALATEWQKPTLSRDTLAYLQYTSGSTGKPKGVMISHANLMQNLETIARGFGHTEQSYGMSWLPPYHDMGLVGGILQPLYTGFPCVLMSPAAFLQRPLRWLQAISKYRATTSGGPDFAYSLCTDKISAEQRATLDLRSWDVAFNGAEPVRMETLERFSTLFAECGFERTAFYPCYGLAEATLIVSGGKKESSPILLAIHKYALENDQVIPASLDEEDTKLCVSSGQPLLEQKIVIVNPTTCLPCSALEVGEIWVSGPSVAQGYWQQPTETLHTFRAYIQHTTEGPFLRTGDLGFLHTGELYVTGRYKDMIIIRGLNHYPQDIETTVQQCHVDLRHDSGATFSIEKAGEERLTIVQEIARNAQADLTLLIEQICQAVAEKHGIQPDAISFIRHGTIPKTSSGKIQRRACKQMYLDHDLDVIFAWQAPSDQELFKSAIVHQKASENSTVLSIHEEDRTQQLLQLLAQLFRIPIGQIDLHKTVSQYGMDSLQAIELQEALETCFGLAVPMADLFDDVSIAHLAERISAYTSTNNDVSSSSRALKVVSGQSPDDHYPLSSNQQALWFLQQLAPESAMYNLAYTVKLAGDVDICALQRALQVLINRHPILRTTFASHGDTIKHVSREENTFAFDVQDYTSLGEEQCLARIQQETHRPFDLYHEYLLRVTIGKCTPTGYLFTLIVHHLLTDFWSLELLATELAEAYTAEIHQTPLPTQITILHYSDYVRWQYGWLESADAERERTYWIEQRLGDYGSLRLPIDFPRPTIQTFNGASLSWELDEATHNTLVTLAKAQRATVSMVLLAAFEAFLSRYSGQDDFIIGLPTTTRNATALAKTPGYFINPVPIRANLTREASFLRLIQDVRTEVLSALQHRQYPFIRIVEEIRLHYPGLSALFQTLFVFYETTHIDVSAISALALNRPGIRFSLGELVMESVKVEHHTTQFDLTLMAADTDNGMAGIFEYNTDLFKPETVERMVQDWQILLHALVTEPERPLSLQPLISSAHQTLLHAFRQGPIQENKETLTIHQLFEEQVTHMPLAPALRLGDKELSYQELNQHANRLAHYLQGQGVGHEVLVGVYLTRSINLVISLLAILKAGGAYVPLDPSYPQERLTFVIADAHLSLLITERSLRALYSEQEIPVLELEEHNERIRDSPSDNLQSSVGSEHLAYSIYTSGSTGWPKGVAIGHASAVSLLTWAKEVYTLQESTGVLASTSINFDLSVFEIFFPLCNGGKIVLVQNILSLLETTGWDDVTLINTVPSAIEELLRLKGIPASVITINLAGETLHRSLVQALYTGSNVNRIYNLYGPSEDTTYSTFALIERDAAEEPSIGRPIMNTTVSILDAHQLPVPIGVQGEIYLGGAGLARAYLNLAALTASVFLPDPFSRYAGARLYKTGDVARYRADGTIEFAGRLDQQIKLRGFRIELGEIEAALLRHPNIASCAVLLSSLSRQYEDPQLVAYIVVSTEQPASNLTLTALRDFLHRRLPAYMHPAALIILEQMPLTPNGKLDRNALPHPSSEQRSDVQQIYIAPRTPLEEELTLIWQKVLHREHIGITDNFFEIGGHSLLATQVLARIRDHFQIELPLRHLFETPTIAGLSPFLSQTKNELLPSIVHAPRDKALPLSYGQQRLWFLDQWDAGNPVYHLCGAARLNGPLQPEAIEASLREIINRHEVLRTTFADQHGVPTQIIHPAISWMLPFLDLRLTPLRERQKLAQYHLEQDARRPFALYDGPLVRALLLQTDEQEYSLGLTLHHSIADGWSIGILLQELSTLYFGFVAGRPASLHPLSLQYADYALWQRTWMQEETLAPHLDYWRTQLAGSDLVLSLPTDHPRPVNLHSDGTLYTFSLDKALTQQLVTLSQQADATLYMTLLASFQILLARYSGQDDIIVGTPIAGRTRSELEVLIGFFVNTLPLRSQVYNDQRFSDLLAQVRETTLHAYAHQDIPFEQLVDLLHPQRDPARNPIVQVMLALQNVPMSKLSLEGITLTPLTIDPGTSKFDLTLFVEQRDQELHCLVEYSTELFERESIAQMMESWHALLIAIIADPAQRIQDLPILSSRQQETLLTLCQGPYHERSTRSCIHQLFEEQVERTPLAPALRFGNEQYTYQELNQRANHLATALQRQGVGPETVVGILMERESSLLIAILAILKTGGAYLPLDTLHPEQRLRQIIAGSACTVLLTAQAYRQRLENVVATLPTEQAPSLSTIEAFFQTPIEQKQNVTSTVKLRNLAYIIYTSGSTGTPKGAMIEHNGLLNHLYAKIRDLQLSSADVIAQTASQCFDISVWQFFAALLVGGCVDILADQISHDPIQLLSAIDERAISICEVVPSLLNVMLEESDTRKEHWLLSRLRWLLVTGEALPPRLCQKWFSRYHAIPLVNAYGPTECSDDVTHYCMAQSPQENAVTTAIGYPLINTQIYILDHFLHLVPIGVYGEIYVGGQGVGRGYMGDPYRTAQVFWPDPFSLQASARLYKTGDVARYRADGSIEFAGRMDHQVKVRGFRIELGEIEAALLRHPAIEACAVLLRSLSHQQGDNDQQLVAYVVVTTAQQTQDLTLTALRDFLFEQLPAYMQPAALIILEQLPLTSNGKLDRSALPHPSLEQLSDAQHTYVAPSTPQEKELTQIWQEILHRERIGIYDNFFEIGGHSLLATQIISRIRDHFQIEVSLRHLFETPTIAGLMPLLSRSQQEQESSQKIATILARLEQLTNEDVRALLNRPEE